MNSLFATAVCRALVALVCCLGVVIAPVAAGFDCRGAVAPEKCKCCKDPEAGCCAANQQPTGKPEPVAPVKPTSLRDVAPMPVTILALVPPAVPRDFPNPASGAAERPPHVARHSLLCIRTV